MKTHQLPRFLLRLGIFSLGLFGCWLLTKEKQPVAANGSIERLRIYDPQARWLQRGAHIEGGELLAGLGFIALKPDSKKVYAPFNGKTTAGEAGCVNFSTADIPNYKFRLCGIDRPKIQKVQKGDLIGSSDLLLLCTLLTVDSQHTWRIVEPSSVVIQGLLNPK